MIEQRISPDGNTCVTIFDRNIFSDSFIREAATAILVNREALGETRITYGNSTYQGLFWAPDSKKYVLSLKYDDGGTYLVLAWLERNSESNLHAYLSLGVSMNELAEYGFVYDENSFRLLEIDYQFLQWSLDSSSMLIYYSFTDVSDEFHSGYFWYNCETGQVSALFELDASE